MFWKRRRQEAFRKKIAVWVERNVGAEYVDEVLDRYEKFNSGISIGGMQEVVWFLDMIERIKAES